MTEAQTTNASPDEVHESETDLGPQQKRKKMLKIYHYTLARNALHATPARLRGRF